MTDAVGSFREAKRETITGNFYGYRFCIDNNRSGANVLGINIWRNGSGYYFLWFFYRTKNIIADIP
jgi:hypothetical protein